VSYYSNNQQHYKKRSSIRTMSVAKIVEIVGSDKRWKDAAKVAVKEAMKTLRGIRGIEVS
jgi:flavin-binding protein dodecin